MEMCKEDKKKCRPDRTSTSYLDELYFLIVSATHRHAGKHTVQLCTQDLLPSPVASRLLVCKAFFVGHVIYDA